MLKLLEELSLEPSPQLHEILALTGEVHLYRQRDREATSKGASRASLLYAATLAEPGLLALLRQAGLAVSTWRRELNVQGFQAPAELAPAEEVPINPKYTASVLERYRERWPGRPLDGRGLAWGILATSETGRVGRYLRQADLDVGRARELVAEAVGISIERLESYSVTDLVRAIVIDAQQLALETGPGGLSLTTSFVVIAMARLGAKELAHDTSSFVYHNTAGFLWWAISGDSLEQAESKLTEYLSWYGDPTTASGARMRPNLMTGYTAGVLEAAKRLAVATRGSSTIHARHLLGGLLAFQPPQGFPEPGARTFLDQVGPGYEKLVEALLEYLRENAPETGGDDLDAWHEALRPGASRWRLDRVPGFDAEGFEGPDRLGIAPEVGAFASLIASKAVEPPLSIGLFGDWGSGKSFFMQKLKRRIEHLAEESAKCERRGRATAYHARIVQIEFNAWHYVEANLWASLATHIFESLHRFFRPRKGKDEDRKRWEQLLGKLDEATELQADAEAMLKEAEQERAAAVALQETKNLELQDVVSQVWTTLKKSYGDEIGRLEETLAFEEVRQLRETLLLRSSEARQLFEQLGIVRRSFLRGLSGKSALGALLLAVLLAVAILGLSSLAPAELERLGARIAELVALLGGLSGWLGTAVRKASCATGAMVSLGEGIRQLGQDDTERLKAAARGVGEARERVTEQRRRIAELRGELRQLRPSQRLASFLEDRASSSDYRKHLGLPAMIRRDFERLHELMYQPPRFAIPRAGNADLLDAREMPADLRVAVRQLDVPFLPAGASGPCVIVEQPGVHWRVRDREHSREIHLRRNGEQLEGHLRIYEPQGFSIPRQADPSSEDHASHLDQGKVPAALADELRRADSRLVDVGQDLEVIVEQPGLHWRIVDRSSAREIDLLLDGDHIEAELEHSLPRIDRIVLYIDDLDRCPPARVVQVLQAVYLLLAFPLFVVVVGVDARWVSRSLDRRYRALWRQDGREETASGGSGDRPADDAATPEDYLEKIFQIPFWLKKMDAETTGDYLRALVAMGSTGDGTAKGPVDAGPDPPPKATGGPAPPTPAPAAAPGGGTTATAGGLSQGAGGSGGGSTDPAASGSGATSGGALAGSGSGDGLSTGSGGPLSMSRTAENLDPKNLVLEGAERSFMIELRHVVGRSPRAVKRFVNVYRLVRAGIPDSRLRGFLGTDEEPGPYRVVLIFLAVGMGAPDLAEDLYKLVDRKPGGWSLGNLLQSIEDNDLSFKSYPEWLEACKLLSEGNLANSLVLADLKLFLSQARRYSFRFGRF